MSPEQTSPSFAKPDPLDKEIVLYGFGLRPPKDYVQTSKDLGHWTAFYWTGTMHQNGVMPRLGFVLLHAPANVIVRTTDGRVMSPAEQGLRGVIDTMTATFSDVTITPVQQGRVGPLPALRIYWKGQARIPGQPAIPIEGFAYGVQDGQNTAILMAIDCAPYGVTEFPVMDASVQTLHKVN